MVMQNGDPMEEGRVGPRKVLTMGIPIGDVVDMIVPPIDMAVDISESYKKLRTRKPGESILDSGVFDSMADDLEGLLKVVRDENEDERKRVGTLKVLLEAYEASLLIIRASADIVKEVIEKGVEEGGW